MEEYQDGTGTAQTRAQEVQTSSTSAGLYYQSQPLVQSRTRATRYGTEPALAVATYECFSRCL